MFTQKELQSLGIAIFVLTLAFAFVFSGSSLLAGQLNVLGFLIYIPIAFIAVFTGFAVHEVAHKVVANHFGYPAAFSYSRNGLLFAAIISVAIGFLIAAPGAVYIYGRPTRKENGIISIAGPSTNFILGVIFIVPALPLIMASGGFLGSGLLTIAVINFFLGAFNMIPIMPLDGAKVLKWNSVIYFTLLVLLLIPVLFFMFGLSML